ncbi:hypothetical protein K502DRAFT_364803 [Neoconidiobolus thromboides FSU 785]|nr:hypothetical protein K502DRAFT_364803 [Neoconidiobolus thromboides FSU 785]
MSFNNPNTIRQQQIFFQKPSNSLLYLRKGSSDKLVFGVLCTLIAAGSVGATYKMYKMITDLINSSLITNPNYFLTGCLEYLL